MSLLLLFGSAGAPVPAETEIDVLEAIAVRWAGEAGLPALFLNRCPEAANLPYGIMQHLDGDYEILASPDDHSPNDYEEHKIQINVWASTSTEALRLGNLARKRFRRAVLDLEGREISCTVGRRIGPFEDPDRAGSESLAFGIFFEVNVTCRSIE